MTTGTLSASRRAPMARFTIRGMMLAMTLLGLFLAVQANRARQQRLAVAWVLGQGGQVTYDWQFDEDDRRRETNLPPGPAWLRRCLGDEFFQVVKAVTLHDTDVEDVSMLAKFPDLKWLHLGGSPVSDLSPLTGLSHLRRLSIGHTLVRDLGPVAQLGQLTTLYAMHTEISDLKPLSQLTQLEVVNVSDTQVRDLTPLVSCLSLRAVLVPSNEVPESEVWKLQQALPNCIVR